jgi:hypothetical protein
MNFLRLRADSHAQYEIRVYAEKMLDILLFKIVQFHQNLPLLLILPFLLILASFGTN